MPDHDSLDPVCEDHDITLSDVVRDAARIMNVPDRTSDPWSELALADDRMHPAADAIEADANRWAQQQRLVTTASASQRLSAARFPRLATRILPTGDASRIGVYAHWVMWLFAADDHHEQAVREGDPTRIHRLYRQLTNRQAPLEKSPVSGLGGAFADLWSHTAPHQSSAWRRRFTRHLLRHGAALTREAAFQRTGNTPTPEELPELRRYANGMFMWDLLEYALGTEVPPVLVARPAWSALCAASNDITAWRNDLVSAPKEVAAGERNNYLLSLAHAHRCPITAAVPLLEQRIAVRIDDLHSARRQLFADARRLGVRGDVDSGVTRVAVLMATMTAAHARWIIESGRYRQAAAARRSTPEAGT